MNEVKKLEEQIKERVFQYNGKDKFENALEFSAHLIKYFSLKANRKKRIYLFLRYSSIVSIAIVTILTIVNISSDNDKFPQWITPAVSIIATILTTLLSITKAQKDWVYSRLTSQKLQKERFLYMQEAGKYSTITPEERVKLFSEQLMNIWDNVQEEWKIIKLDK